MKSLIFKTAWSLFKNNIFTSFAFALSAAWKEVKLKMALAAGKVKLTFRKANGEITQREGTLNSHFFNYSNNGSKQATKAGLIKFYSLTNDAFRACRIERLISYEAIK